ncbi:UNVERIFIED_CONTAM: hypothetical protein Sangu_2828300 [Sesamum angustifolium]|uniref:Uncharacterized protein n=1 Tax=Sesamum angustifolium TaxID=2727405 RepID=A0AAW2IQJ1_9LAMI
MTCRTSTFTAASTLDDDMPNLHIHSGFDFDDDMPNLQHSQRLRLHPRSLLLGHVLEKQAVKFPIGSLFLAVKACHFVICVLLKMAAGCHIIWNSKFSHELLERVESLCKLGYGDIAAQRIGTGPEALLRRTRPKSQSKLYNEDSSPGQEFQTYRTPLRLGLSSIQPPPQNSEVPNTPRQPRTLHYKYKAPPGIELPSRFWRLLLTFFTSSLILAS